MKASDLTVPQISRLLADRIDSLAAELLPGGRRIGSQWAASDLAGGAPRTGGSLRVNLTGSHQGIWRDHATAEHGDPLDLIQGALSLSLGEAVRWALAWLGLDDDAPVPKPRPIPKPSEPTRAERRRAAKGPAIWRASGPINDTPAQAHLRGRRITVSLPPSLRFHPALDYWDTERDEPVFRGKFPALIAGITCWPSGGVAAIQAVYLDPKTGGKAEVDSPKKTFGPAKGGAVRLAPHGVRLAICEGVETALSVWQSCLGLPVWATVGTAGFGNVVIPRGVKDIIIAADADEAGEAAAQKAAQRFLSEGLRVRIARPPHGAGDFNDALVAASTTAHGKAIHV